MTPRNLRRSLCIACLGAWLAATAQAHGYASGDLYIDHPYASPSVPGAGTGAAYLSTLQNKGARADRLLRARTPAAARVEIHSMTLDAAGVMRMREEADLPLPPGAATKMQPGMGPHLMLFGLAQPLKDGDSFPMTLEFERAGTVEVKVVVQAPRPSPGKAAGPMH